MAKFSKEILNFLREASDDGGMGPSVQDKITTPIPVSANQITPGDLLIFNYLGEQRAVLAVRTRRTGRNSAVYFHWSQTKKTGSKLLTCFKLKEAPSSVLSMVMENLYKKRGRASYYDKHWGPGPIAKTILRFVNPAKLEFNEKQIAGLKSILGSSTFRTFKLDRISNLHKVQIKR